MLSDCFLHQVIQSLIAFQFLRLNLVAPTPNVTSELFPLLVLNKSRKTCLALQRVIVVVCSTAFFTKVSLFSKAFY